MRLWPQELEGDGKVIAGISWKESQEVEDSNWLDLNTKCMSCFTLHSQGTWSLFRNQTSWRSVNNYNDNGYPPA